MTALADPFHLTGSLIRYNNDMAAVLQTQPIIRSDSLRDWLKLLDTVPEIRPLVGNIIQVIVVLDASYVQREIRWRVAARRDGDARTSLHEAIVAGAIIAFAPPFLEKEIEKYIPEIAEQTGVSVDGVRQEWRLLRPLIRFYEPLSSPEPISCADPKDFVYIQTFEQLDADFVCTADHHFVAMVASVMPAGLDRILRDYARSTTVLLTVKLGSTLAVMVGSQLLSAVATAIASAMSKLPPAIKLALGLCVGVALLHPTSRRKFQAFIRMLWTDMGAGVSASLSSDAAAIFVESAHLAAASENAIQATLPRTRSGSAIARACLICAKVRDPLPVSEIARRIQSSGYSSRSRDFTTYVRRILRNDSRFTMNSSGLWQLRPGEVGA